MKILKKAVLLIAVAISFDAVQAQDASSSSAVRRGNARERDRKESAQPGVTQRMQKFYDESEVSDADMQWMRVIYRQLDLDKPKNAALYYPEDVIDGQENLFRIIMRLLADNAIPAYEYLDGREIFNDQYRLNVGDMLDRFYITNTPAKGSSERNPKFVIEESDVPSNEVLSYYIVERWVFDSRDNRMTTRVEAVCPVLHRTGDFGEDVIKYPMFWVKMENLRPYLAQQEIFVDDDNNLARYTYDDFFAMNLYEGDIYKTRNLMNKSMAQMFPDPDDLKRAQDSIQKRLDTFDDNIWVPTREELIAKNVPQSGDSIVINDRDDDKKSSRSSRGRNEPKVKKPKAPKNNNSGSAVRSVRRRR